MPPFARHVMGSLIPGNEVTTLDGSARGWVRYTGNCRKSDTRYKTVDLPIQTGEAFPLKLVLVLGLVLYLPVTCSDNACMAPNPQLAKVL